MWVCFAMRVTTCLPIVARFGLCSILKLWRYCVCKCAMRIQAALKIFTEHYRTIFDSIGDYTNDDRNIVCYCDLQKN